jgi:phasin family protein
MYDKFFEQAQTAMKPMTELMTFNAKLMEDVAEKQKSFVTDIIEDGMSFAKEMSAQKDYSGVYQTQKAYLEGMQAKWIAASTEAYEMMTSTQEKMSDVIKSSVAV